MLQRGSSCIISLDPGITLAYSAYSENGRPIEMVDILSDSIPHAVLVEFHKEMTKQVIELDKELIAGLNRAGFATNNGEEDSDALTKSSGRFPVVLMGQDHHSLVLLLENRHSPGPPC